MIKAKKKFGQNFLKDSFILDKIIQSIPKNSDINLVEIGAGLGDLTKKLLEISKVRSYEIDEELFTILSKNFKTEITNSRLNLILGDVLEFWQKDNLLDESYFLVANLPYYVATNIILKAIDDKNCVGFIVMIQKEVALKFTLNDKNSNSLSLIANLNGEINLLFDVPNTSFKPMPKVMSSVIKFDKFNNFGDLKMQDYFDYKNFLRICFSSPRKTLFSNLTTKFKKNFVVKIFEDINLDKKIRPHQSNNTLLIKIFNFLKVENGRKE
ncbi:16S rRNA (adenine(1518)-N(6)/adenine(1519)-N(6))-dimethyltransferase RsmA [Campylobacter sp. FMV-PI01]|uniref:Ribosomal RNA small subunit methyltransferase A n=1 Tax=Campylobacter portucalensis TaxID=2608384 RepID=A0A6L5WIC7_9BACT|nr:16S rRNA (adenine(1518)-N(6)/adenine(1519)-N(6))-dimethyltransferase RsmA [Campylobacter portucalensis]MSN95775.1 16S rRNA (adenine(1518)-N(6)/adenine(1519)-N(6))-dimethyltransferase RsmA [Campylobacter portucalensis]